MLQNFRAWLSAKFSGRLLRPWQLLRFSHFEKNQRLDQELILNLREAKRWPKIRQWRYVHKFYSEREILVTKISLSLFLISLTVLSLNFYFTHLQIVPATGGEYVEAVVGTPTYINPIFSQTNSVDQDLSHLIFSSLVSVNKNGEIVPDLVESFTIDDTQTTYTFILKPDLTWHDGLSLTASDVAFTFQSIKDSNFKSPLYNTFRNVQIKLVDERTIQLILPEPFAPFISLLTFGILPEHLWQEIDPSHATLAELNLKPIGSGPYQFSSLVKDKKGNIKEYSLKRFDKWYGTGPFVENINFKFFATLDEAITNVKDGNADGVGLIANTQNSELANQGDKISHQLSLPQYTAIFFNQGNNSALTDKSVREALALATNREQIIANTFANSAEPINDPLLTKSTAVFDSAQAEAKLESAGWKKVLTEDQIQTPYIRQKRLKAGETPTTLEIKLTTVQKEENIKAAETIREQWQAVGVKVNLEIVDITEIQKNIIKPRAYEALLFGQILGGDQDPYPFWHTSQANDPGLNLALYSNKDADKLLEEARRTTNQDVRSKDYAAFAEKLQADIPAIFLYSLKFTYFLPNKIQGMAGTSIKQASDRFSTVNEWYIKTKKSIKF